MPSVRSAVTSCTRPGRNAPSHQQPPLAIADGGRLDGVRLLLAGHERAAAGPVRPPPADLDLGAVDAQVHALRRRRRRTRPPACAAAARGSPGTAKPRGPPAAAGSHATARVIGGAVHPVEQREGGVRELEPQHDQGGDDPVGERQLRPGPARLRAQPVAAAAPLPQPGFLLRRPRRRPARRSACPGGDVAGRCRYDATRPRGPIATTHLDRARAAVRRSRDRHAKISPSRPASCYRAPS